MGFPQTDLSHCLHAAARRRHTYGLLHHARYLIAALLLLPFALLHAEETALSAAFTHLQAGGFDAIEKAVDLMAAGDDERDKPVLEALLDGRLYLRKSDRRVVIVDKTEGDYHISDAQTGEDLGTIGKRKLKRITVNNQLRSHIRDALAAIGLGSPKAAVRLDAARSMTGDTDPASLQQLRQALQREQDNAVREALQTALAVAQLDADDTGAQLAAIEQVSGNLDPAIRGKLARLAKREDRPAVAAAAKQALQDIEFSLQLNSLIETLFFGLSLGSVLVLAAIGLAITFGVMGVINMAHGELIMLGAYTTYVIQLLMPEHIGLSLLVSIPAAFLVSGVVGIAIERGVIRFLYGRPLETLLATFGVSLVLQQTVRSIFSPLNRMVETPAWMSGSWEINSVLSLTINRLTIIAFCLLVFAALFFVLKRTPLGLQVRAVSQNRNMARAMGVRSQWVDAMTFGLGSGIAGVAGVALSQLTNVGPNLGQSYIVDSFMVVVFGGVGNLWGTLVGGLTLGVANKFLEPWSGAVLAKILVLLFIILFIQKRPRGLFPQKGRAAET
ncbi:MAG: urea ABC transporter permease subunit UrtB [Candidatus Thiodiazotropha sp.]